MQPKNISFPTDAKLLHAAIRGLNRLANKHGVRLRQYLKGRAGDAANAILSAVGHNFRRILAWLRDLLRQILIAILRLLISRSTLIPAS